MPTSEAQSLFDAAGRLSVSLSCVNCRYNLRTLARDAACPECGTAVATSAESAVVDLAPSAWLARVALGVRLLHWASLLFVAGGVIAAFVCIPLAISFHTVAPFALAIVACVFSCMFLILGAAIVAESRLPTMATEQRRAANRIRLTLLALGAVIVLALSASGVRGITLTAGLAWLLLVWLWHESVQYVVNYLCFGMQHRSSLGVSLAFLFRVSAFAFCVGLLTAAALLYGCIADNLVTIAIVFLIVVPTFGGIYFFACQVEMAGAQRNYARLLARLASEARLREEMDKKAE